MSETLTGELVGIRMRWLFDKWQADESHLMDSAKSLSSQEKVSQLNAQALGIQRCAIELAQVEAIRTQKEIRFGGNLIATPTPNGADYKVELTQV